MKRGNADEASASSPKANAAFCTRFLYQGISYTFFIGEKYYPSHVSKKYAPFSLEISHAVIPKSQHYWGSFADRLREQHSAIYLRVCQEVGLTNTLREYGAMPPSPIFSSIAPALKEIRGHES